MIIKLCYNSHRIITIIYTKKIIMKKLYLPLLFMVLSGISTTSITASEQKSTGLPLSVENIQELARLQLIEKSLKENYDDCKKNNATNDMKYFYHHLRQNHFSQKIILDPTNADKYHQECDKASKEMDQALYVKINNTLSQINFK